MRQLWWAPSNFEKLLADFPNFSDKLSFSQPLFTLATSSQANSLCVTDFFLKVWQVKVLTVANYFEKSYSRCKLILNFLKLSQLLRGTSQMKNSLRRFLKLKRFCRRKSSARRESMLSKTFVDEKMFENYFEKSCSRCNRSLKLFSTSPTNFASHNFFPQKTSWIFFPSRRRFFGSWKFRPSRKVCRGNFKSRINV